MVRPTRTRTAGVFSSSPSRRARQARATLAAAALAGLLAGCATHPVQSQEHSTISGQNSSIGPILVLDATIRLTGGTGVLYVTLYNGGQQPDSLTAVTSKAAGTITLPTGTLPTGTPRTGTPPTGTSVPLPPRAAVFLNQPSNEIMLGRLAGSALPGQSLPVTLTFASAGSLDLVVPVLAGDTGPQSSTAPTASAPGSAPSGSSSPPAP